MPEVFVSASERDANIVRRLSQDLRQAGVEVFWPGNLDNDSKQDVSRQVMQNLREASEVVVVLSGSGLSNPNVLFELGAAASRGKKISIIDIPGRPKLDAPFDLSGLQVEFYRSEESFVKSIVRSHTAGVDSPYKIQRPNLRNPTKKKVRLV